MIVIHTAIAIIIMVAMIIWAKVNPVIALVVGALYIGIAGGLGLAGSVTALAEGFGDIMVDVGLLIGFGVLIGALLNQLGALRKTVDLLVQFFGPRRLPYAMALALNAFFPSIYPDVQLVLAAPLARNASSRLGRNGLGLMAGALVVGIPVGVVFVAPGLGAVSIAGLLNVPLSTSLLWGLIVALSSTLLSLLLYAELLRRGWWNTEKDETSDDVLAEPGSAVSETGSGRNPPLGVSMLSVLIPIVFIAGGAIARTFGIENTVLEFLSEPVFALFVGLVYAYVLSRFTAGRKATDFAFGTGLETSGNILLITGLGGSLAAVIKKTELSDVLTGLFSAEAGIGIIAAVALSWIIAAVLHVAIGSINVAAITAAGIIGPATAGIDAPPVIIGLAISAGAVFAVHFNSNFFWMFSSLLGLTTRGALKSMTLMTAVVSVVALLITILLATVVSFV